MSRGDGSELDQGEELASALQGETGISRPGAPRRGAPAKPRSRSGGRAPRRAGAKLVLPKGAAASPVSGCEGMNCSAPIVLDRFETGDYRLRFHHYDLLASIVVDLFNLAGSQAVLCITGHTDGSGAAELNLGLSWARAYEVRQYLAEHFNGKIPVEVQVAGQGEMSHLPGASAARNRRVEIRACTRPPGPQQPLDVIPVRGQARKAPQARRPRRR